MSPARRTRKRRPAMTDHVTESTDRATELTAVGDESAARLTDVFAGRLELTANERSFILHLMSEWYMSGGSWRQIDGNRRTFVRGISAKFGALKLERMVSPDGSKLVSIEEHDAIASATRRRPPAAVTAENITNEQILSLGDDPTSSLLTKAWCIAAMRIVYRSSKRKLKSVHEARSECAKIINARDYHEE